MIRPHWKAPFWPTPFWLVSFWLALGCIALPPAVAADVIYKGVNLSGAEYGGCSKTDARYGYTYIYPPTSLIDAFLAMGMNTFRVPFCWERLQPTALGDLDAAELQRLDNTVDYITAHKASIILDPHDYALYWNKKIGDGTTKAMFADLWKRLAMHYRNNPRVIFDLMNEPHDIPGETWLDAANTAIAAIRSQQAGNLILVPGVAWTGAHSWTSTSYGTPNAVTMLGVQDPDNNYAFDVHQYLDADSSGTTAVCVSPDIGVTRIQAFEDWLRQHHKKAFLGEFAGGRNDTCFAALDNLLGELKSNGDIWLGWTYWSAGPWQSNYMFDLTPTSYSANPNQIVVIRKYLQPPCVTNGTPCAPQSPTLNSVTPND